MAEPASLDEYFARFHANQRLDGFGFHVAMHVPCPFCAAPDWIVHKIVDTAEALSAGAVCRECGRGAKAIIVELAGGFQLEVVQTAGDPQPPWLTPPMRDLRRTLQ